MPHCNVRTARESDVPSIIEINRATQIGAPGVTPATGFLILLSTAESLTALIRRQDSGDRCAVLVAVDSATSALVGFLTVHPFSQHVRDVGGPAAALAFDDDGGEAFDVGRFFSEASVARDRQAFVTGSSLDCVCETAYVPLLGVSPAARGAGVARALLDAGLLWAARNNYRRTITRVIHKPIHNTASDTLHQRFGFVPLGWETVTLPFPQQALSLVDGSGGAIVDKPSGRVHTTWRLYTRLNY